MVKRVFVIILLLLVVVSVANAISIYQFSSHMSSKHADAAIVLGAAVWGDQPSPVYKGRIVHALWLYQSGFVHNIIFTGGVGENDLISEAEVGREYAIIAGVDRSDILVDSESSVTYENLKNAKELADERSFSSFLIVSDPLHMKRSMEIAYDLGLIAYPSPTPSTRYLTWRSMIPFLIRETYYLLSYQVRNFVNINVDMSEQSLIIYGWSLTAKIYKYTPH